MLTASAVVSSYDVHCLLLATAQHACAALLVRCGVLTMLCVSHTLGRQPLLLGWSSTCIEIQCCQAGQPSGPGLYGFFINMRYEPGAVLQQADDFARQRRHLLTSSHQPAGDVTLTELHTYAVRSGRAVVKLCCQAWTVSLPFVLLLVGEASDH